MSYLKKLVVLTLIVTMAPLFSCERKEKKPAPTGKKTVEVTFVSPEGETDRPHNIVASFGAPMVAVTNVGRTKSKGPIQVAPKIDGTYHWLGTRTVSFVPKKPFPFATGFSVTIDPGVTDIDGNGLAAPKSWTFQTARPAIVSSKPADKSADAEADQKVLLRFNQPVDPTTVKKHLTLSLITGKGQTQNIVSKVRRPADKEWKDEKTPIDYAVIVEPAKQFPLGASIQLMIDDKFTGSEGPLAAGKALQITFSTYAALKVDEIRCTKECDPAQAITVQLNNNVVPKDVIGKIKITPEIKLSNDATWRTSWLELHGDFKPQTKYTVTLPTDLTDVHGTHLSEPYQFTYATGDYEPSMSLVTGNGVLEAHGPAEIAVTTRNITTLKTKYARLSQDEIVPLITGGVLYANPKAMSTVDWSAQNDIAIKTKTNDTEIQPLSLKPGLSDETTGVMLLDVWSPEIFYEHKGKKDYTHYGALIQVTDIGITGKFSDDGMLVWTTSLAKGTPLADVSVTVRNKKNEIVWDGTTNAKGLAVTKIKSPSNEVVYVFAELDGDVAFSTSQWNSGFTPWDFGMWQSFGRTPLTAYLFTERGIYKPGETVHLKALVRNVTDAGVSIVSGIKGTIKAKDQRGREYYNAPVTLSDTGGAHADIKLPRTVATGRSWIKLELGEEKKKRSFGTSINVAAYKPAEFKLTMKPEHDDVIAGQKVKVDVSADYLFGEPMKGAGLSWSVFRRHTWFAPEGYDNYLFGADFPDPEERWKYFGFMKLEGRTRGKLDNDGDAFITVPTKAGTVPVITNYVVESTVTDINERTISNRTGVTVHPGEFYIGMRSPSFIAAAGTPIETKFISVDTTGKKVTGKRIDAKLLKREWHAVKKKAVVGYAYESEAKDVEVGACSVATGDQPEPCSLTPKSSGMHIVRATSKDGQGNTILTEGWIYATGPGEAAWKPETHDRLDLVADKKSYAPGETATILVKSPFQKAHALITYERSGIVHQETTVLEGNAPEIKVPLTVKSIPNLYVSVVMVAGRVGKETPDWGSDPGRPRVKVGYINLPVSPVSKKLGVDVALDKQTAGPGDEVNVTVKVTGADGKPARSELTIMAVDTGSLILTDYKTPDAFDKFYAEQGLGVDTSDSRIHIIGRRHYGVKGEPVGGGGAEAAARGARSKFLTVAYWNPSIMTNANGEAKVNFKLPDNLTTFKVMAVASTADRFGSGDAEVVSTKPFMMRAALPFFAAVGDKFKAGVVLSNRTKNKLSGEITAQAGGAVSVGDATESFDLAPEEQKEIFFSYDAAKLGQAELTFLAKAGDASDGLKLPLKVKVTQPKEVFTSYGSSEESAKELFEAPENVWDDFGGMDVSVASTAMVGLTDASLYLLSYPYECIEQKISKAIGAMIYDEIAREYGIENPDSEKHKALIEDTLFAIYEAQNWRGGVSFWPGLKASNYLTIYALQFMHLAKAHGLDVDKKAFEKSAKYVHDLLRWDAKKKKMNEKYLNGLKAYALYVLALIGEPEHAYQETLYAKLSNLSLIPRAQLILAMKLSGGQGAQFGEFVNYVNNHLAITAGEAHVEEVDAATTKLWSSMYADAYVLMALMKIQPAHPLLAKMARYLLSNSRRGYWVSTHTTAAVLMALHDYIGTHEREVPDFVTTVTLGSKELMKASFEGRTTRSEEKFVPMDELLKVKSPAKLEYKKKGKGRMYYRTRLTYASKETPLPPMEEGFTILKTFAHYDSGKSDDHFKRGDVVRVKLSFVVPASRSYVVINDGLPAGLEAVNFTLATAQKGLLANQKRDFSIDHVETYGDRVLIFANRLDAGSYEFEYLAKAATKGKFSVPSAHIEEMYNPEVFGRTATGEIDIE